MTQQAIEFYFILFGFFSAAFGACVGSFLNVCIYRIPLDQSVVKPRSHCPTCGNLIVWYMNIPVLSWLFLRGRCAYCKNPISYRYALVELLTAVLFVLVYLKLVAPALLGTSPLAHPLLVPIFWLVLAGLIVGTFIDFDHYILPDSVTIGGMVLGPILSALVPALQGTTIWWESLMQSGIGLAVGFGALFAVAWAGEKVFKKEAMGFGDVKLMGAIGAFFGWPSILFCIFLSSLLGSIVGVSLIVSGGAQMQSRIPFGPYIAASAVIWMFYGPQVFQWYVNLMR